MKKINFLILFIVITIICIFLSKPNKIININKDNLDVKDHSSIHMVSSSEKYNKMIEPVIIIYILDGNNLLGSGTGFSISYDKKNNQTYFLTNNHICESVKLGAKMIAKQSLNNMASLTYDGSPGMNLEIIDAIFASDLCLLRTDSFVRPVKISKSKLFLTQGDELYVIGAPNSNFPIILETYFSGYIDRKFASTLSYDGYDIIMVSEMIHPGHSGSPIYTANGDLAGIVFAAPIRRMIAPDLALHSYGGLGISMLDILNFLDKNNIKY